MKKAGNEGTSRERFQKWQIITEEVRLLVNHHIPHPDDVWRLASKHADQFQKIDWVRLLVPKSASVKCRDEEEEEAKDIITALQQFVPSLGTLGPLYDRRVDRDICSMAEVAICKIKRDIYFVSMDIMKKVIVEAWEDWCRRDGLELIEVEAPNGVKCPQLQVEDGQVHRWMKDAKLAGGKEDVCLYGNEQGVQFHFKIDQGDIDIEGFKIKHRFGKIFSFTPPDSVAPYGHIHLGEKEEFGKPDSFSPSLNKRLSDFMPWLQS